ncbi:MAG: LamG domain-containing protein [Verrucomicrobia bacterium]|nr:LamG domain-containing protein [Verrucomicrobiota bacterium]
MKPTSLLPANTRLTFAFVLFGVQVFGGAVLRAGDANANAVNVRLRDALTFHASFDGQADADFAAGDRRIFTAPNMNHPRTGAPGLPASGVVSLARGQGKFGDALRFHKKVPDVVFFQTEKNFPYRTNNWTGTVSFWIKLNPEEDLEPGYCDPLQITPRDWNDAAFFVDFSKDERPRHFRLGAFADRAVWDPNKRDYDRVPLPERPMVTVTKPPFSRERWTHVAFTFANFNTGRKDGVARLYLDGQLQGTLAGREQTFTWEPAKAIMMLGVSYVGLFDDLAVFNRALTEAEIGALQRLPAGVHSLKEQ